MVLDGQDVGTKYPVLKTSIWKHVQELLPYHKGDVTHGMTAQLSVIGLIQSPDHLRKAEVKICRILRTKFDTYSARTEDFSLDTANKKTISSGQDVSYILINQMPNSAEVCLELDRCSRHLSLWQFHWSNDTVTAWSEWQQHRWNFIELIHHQSWFCSSSVHDFRVLHEQIRDFPLTASINYLYPHCVDMQT